MNRSTPLSDQRFFASAPASVGLARDFADKTLRSWNLDALADDVRVCVSEPATNAVVHANTYGRFLVRLTVGGDHLHLEVHDDHPRRPAVRLPTHHATSGRGLHLVAALATAWGVDARHPSGKIVWSRFRLAPALWEVPC
ncbi:ATP-binding protein [Streptomyces sp. URMC 126]|uniref:ATP-binding protein n=1 Tax=Streptomyces sp. URMC 126 TaxID=3423401 RepID=UPI003F1D2300